MDLQRPTALGGRGYATECSIRTQSNEMDSNTPLSSEVNIEDLRQLFVPASLESLLSSFKGDVRELLRLVDSNTSIRDIAAASS